MGGVDSSVFGAGIGLSFGSALLHTTRGYERIGVPGFNHVDAIGWCFGLDRCL